MVRLTATEQNVRKQKVRPGRVASSLRKLDQPAATSTGRAVDVASMGPAADSRAN